VRNLRRKSVYRITVSLTGLRSVEILLIVILDDSGQCGQKAWAKSDRGRVGLCALPTSPTHPCQTSKSYFLQT
jgi:hypothetical protein